MSTITRDARAELDALCVQGLDWALDLSRILPSSDSLTTRGPIVAGPSRPRALPAPHPDAALPSTPPLDRSAPRAPPA